MHIQNIEFHREKFMRNSGHNYKKLCETYFAMLLFRKIGTNCGSLLWIFRKHEN